MSFTRIAYRNMTTGFALYYMLFTQGKVLSLHHRPSLETVEVVGIGVLFAQGVC